MASWRITQGPGMGASGGPTLARSLLHRQWACVGGQPLQRPGPVLQPGGDFLPDLRLEVESE